MVNKLATESPTPIIRLQDHLITHDPHLPSSLSAWLTLLQYPHAQRARQIQPADIVCIRLSGGMCLSWAEGGLQDARRGV